MGNKTLLNNPLLTCKQRANRADKSWLAGKWNKDLLRANQTLSKSAERYVHVITAIQSWTR
jgi:hypothetical protein